MLEESVQFSHSVVSDSLRPHGPQHTRLSCSSPTPRVYSNSRPSSQWCHPTISVPFSFHLQSFPASRSFPMSQFFTSGGQSIGAPASASVLPMNIQDWFPLRLEIWLDFLAVQGILKSLLQHHSSKASILRHSAFFTVQLSHPYMTTGKTIALTRHTFIGMKVKVKVKSLSHVRLFATPLTVPTRFLHPWDFLGKSGLPFPSTGDLPNPGTEPGSPAL